MNMMCFEYIVGHLNSTLVTKCERMQPFILMLQLIYLIIKYYECLLILFIYYFMFATLPSSSKMIYPQSILMTSLTYYLFACNVIASSFTPCACNAIASFFVLS